MCSIGYSGDGRCHKVIWYALRVSLEPTTLNAIERPHDYPSPALSPLPSMEMRRIDYTKKKGQRFDLTMKSTRRGLSWRNLTAG